MSSWALVPVRARHACKTRLAAHLSPAARLFLVREMLAGVLDAAARSPQVDGVAVVSSELDDLPPGVLGIVDRGIGLNPALAHAAATLARRGASRLVIVLADLPLVTSDDIGALIAAADSSGLALAPDWQGHGTNAVCTTDVAGFEPRFGPASFARHLDLAKRRGISPTLVCRPAFAFDVDEERELRELAASPRFAECFTATPLNGAEASWRSHPGGRVSIARRDSYIARSPEASVSIESPPGC